MVVVMKPELHINFRDRLAKLSTTDQKAMRWQEAGESMAGQAWLRWEEGEDDAACWWLSSNGQRAAERGNSEPQRVESVSIWHLAGTMCVGSIVAL